MTTRNHPVKRPSLANVTTNGSGLPSRGVGHGPEGVGKTSLGCATPKPIFIITREVHRASNPGPRWAPEHLRVHRFVPGAWGRAGRLL
jgi:hypothetical protein